MRAKYKGSLLQVVMWLKIIFSLDVYMFSFTEENKTKLSFVIMECGAERHQTEGESLFVLIAATVIKSKLAFILSDTHTHTHKVSLIIDWLMNRCTRRVNDIN